MYNLTQIVYNFTQVVYFFYTTVGRFICFTVLCKLFKQWSNSVPINKKIYGVETTATSHQHKFAACAEGSMTVSLVESLYTESSDNLPKSSNLCPNWTHLYTVSLWEIHANFHIIAFHSVAYRGKGGGQSALLTAKEIVKNREKQGKSREKEGKSREKREEKSGKN